MQVTVKIPSNRFIAAKAAVTEDIKEKIEFVAGGNPEKATAADVYQGTAYSVRESLFKNFRRTHRYFEQVLLLLMRNFLVAVVRSKQFVSHTAFRIHGSHPVGMPSTQVHSVNIQIALYIMTSLLLRLQYLGNMWSAACCTDSPEVQTCAR